eukprot:1155627-Pelagomonas_calceolata.AAC.1
MPHLLRDHLLRDQVFTIVHDEHSAHVQPDVVELASRLEELKGRTPGHKQDGPAEQRVCQNFKWCTGCPRGASSKGRNCAELTTVLDDYLLCAEPTTF